MKSNTLLRNAIVFSVAAAGSPFANAKTCDTLNDFYSSSGCTVTADQSYSAAANGKGSVNVRILQNTKGSRSPQKILHIVGPYDIPQAEPFGLSVMAEHIAKLRSQGIDVAYYDFSRSNQDYVQSKALALIDAMKTLDSHRGATKPSVMVGLSMGGVVARYALTTMESEQYRHGVKYYVSFDAPHSGAHVPISLQKMPVFLMEGFEKAKSENKTALSFGNFLNRVANMLSFRKWNTNRVNRAKEELSAAEGNLQALLDDQFGSPAAKQMLINNIFSRHQRDPLGDTLQSELEDLGFPQGLGLQTTNIALVKGSLTGKNFMPSHPYYFNFQSGRTENDLRELNIWSSVVGADPFTAHPNALPGCTSASCGGTAYYYHHVFSGEMRYKVASNLTGNGKYRDALHTPQHQSSATYAYDIMPCSTLDLPEKIADSVNDPEGELSGVGITDINEFVAFQKESCFIPTYSALAKKSQYGSSSPFDIIYGSSDNLSHLTLSPGKLREGGNGNFFEDDFELYIHDTYVTSANWSYDNGAPSSYLLTSGGGTHDHAQGPYEVRVTPGLWTRSAGPISNRYGTLYKTHPNGRRSLFNIEGTAKSFTFENDSLGGYEYKVKVCYEYMFNTEECDYTNVTTISIR